MHKNIACWSDHGPSHHHRLSKQLLSLSSHLYLYPFPTRTQSTNERSHIQWTCGGTEMFHFVFALLVIATVTDRQTDNNKYPKCTQCNWFCCQSIRTSFPNPTECASNPTDMIDTSYNSKEQKKNIMLAPLEKVKLFCMMAIVCLPLSGKLRLVDETTATSNANTIIQRAMMLNRNQFKYPYRYLWCCHTINTETEVLSNGFFFFFFFDACAQTTTRVLRQQQKCRLFCRSRSKEKTG